MFTLQPESVKIVRRQPYVIRAFAPAAVRYQWYRNGKPVAGETGSTLTVVHPQDGETHDYRVVAYRDDSNYTVSDTATITAVRKGFIIMMQ